MVSKFFHTATDESNAKIRKNKTLKLTVLPQAEIKGSTASISLRSRQHCQFLTITFSFKKQEELIKAKRLASIMNHVLSKHADLEKICLLFQ